MSGHVQTHLAVYQQAVQSEPLPAGTEHILFIDDEPAIAAMQTRQLRRLGYTVTAFSSSVEALQTFRSSPRQFDLVITDMTMPQLTGDQLALEIRKIRTDCPVILCTGFSEKINGDTIIPWIDELLMKPVDRKLMAEAIRRVIGKFYSS